MMTACALALGLAVSSSSTTPSIDVVDMAQTATAAALQDTLSLRMGDCVPSPDLVHDLVAIELGFDRVVEDAAAFEARIFCEPSQLRVEIWPTGTTRKIPLREVVREGGARLIALNITELAQDARRAPGPLIEDSVRFRAGASSSVRYLSAPGRPGFGVHAGGGLDASAVGSWPWSLHVDGGFEQSSAALALGDVRTRAISARALGGLRFDPTLRWSVFGWLGARAGWVWLEGRGDEDAVQTQSGNGPWFGPVVAARVRYGGAFGVALGVEGGWTVTEVFGSVADRRVGLLGGWFGADLTLDWGSG